MPLKCSAGDILFRIHGKNRRIHFAHPDAACTPVCGHPFTYAGSLAHVVAVDENYVAVAAEHSPPRNTVDCQDCFYAYKAAMMLSAK